MNSNKKLLILILTSIVVWVLGYFVFHLFRDHPLLSLTIAVLSGFLAAMFYWVFSQKFLDNLKTVKLVAIVVIGSVVGLGIKVITSPQSIQITVNCGAITSVKAVEASQDDDVTWVSSPQGKNLVIDFPLKSPFYGNHFVGTSYAYGGRIIVSNPTYPLVDKYYYTGTCDGKKISGTPMIQIPRRTP